MLDLTAWKSVCKKHTPVASPHRRGLAKLEYDKHAALFAVIGLTSAAVSLFRHGQGLYL